MDAADRDQRGARSFEGGAATGELEHHRSTDREIAAPAAADPGIAESVALAFRRLPPTLQIVATLALIEELPYAEIADALELPIGTVKSRVFRAVRALRQELARLGIRHE